MFAFLVFVAVGGVGLFAMFLFDFITKKKTEINGAHVLVTGGSSGIGRSLAIKLVANGANVTIMARNVSKLQETLEEVKKQLIPERKVLALSVDLNSGAQAVENSIKQACDTMGPVDILINCAGFAVCGLFEDTPAEHFKTMVNTNYLGSVYSCLAVIKSMKERRQGHVVFVSSIGGQFGIFGFTAYAPSKFAIRGLAEALFMEVKPYNVGISVVFPPDTDTPGFANENKNKPEETHLICASGGLFSPEQVAEKIILGIKGRKFLISCGFDGFVVKTLTCGVSPASSLIELFTQVILMGPLRLVLACYSYHYDHIVSKGMKKREKTKKAE